MTGPHDISCRKVIGDDPKFGTSFSPCLTASRALANKIVAPSCPRIVALVVPSAAILPR